MKAPASPRIRAPRRATVWGIVAFLVVTLVAITWRPWQLFSSDHRIGTWTDRTNQPFTARNGLSSKYHVYASGLSADSVEGVVFHFHGDGAYEFTHPNDPYALGGGTGIVAEAKARGYVVVSVLSPDQAGEVTWWEDGARNAGYVADLMNAILDRYPDAAGNTWLVGYSGGSQFITQFFLPLYAGRITGGGAVMFGGGGRPYDVVARPYPDALKERFPMFWYTGSRDNGRRSDDGYDALGDPVHGARSGVEYYAAEGFHTAYEWPRGVGHDLDHRFGAILGQQLDLHPR